MVRFIDDYLYFLIKHILVILQGIFIGSESTWKNRLSAWRSQRKALSHNVSGTPTHGLEFYPQLVVVICIDYHNSSKIK